ncbi:winged helix DNA-binding protein [Actinospica sp. MGRD01-02]|uniref:Winged helix DNA-binding protein n=1 Tax=Actinospica acidithermotolerans TaxID=2828514 RepID=A0A941E9D6_9ACTN|nr:winged helix DNA-binding protein [Actinospica acidithermotolerans]MBR7826237.1 winged helix DNA-binding protein [Actinospica acidithermotolerans]
MRKAEHLRFAILAAKREGNRLLTQALSPHGLTPSQAEVLRLLQQHGTLSLNGLGQLLVCESGTNPSRLVERTVAAGLVERSTDDADRRYLHLSLTPEGERLASTVAAIEQDLHGLRLIVTCEEVPLMRKAGAEPGPAPRRRAGCQRSRARSQEQAALGTDYPTEGRCRLRAAVRQAVTAASSSSIVQSSRFPWAAP